jgi:hypothetical protein
MNVLRFEMLATEHEPQRSMKPPVSEENSKCFLKLVDEALNETNLTLTRCASDGNSWMSPDLIQLRSALEKLRHEVINHSLRRAEDRGFGLSRWTSEWAPTELYVLVNRMEGYFLDHL